MGDKSPKDKAKQKKKKADDKAKAEKAAQPIQDTLAAGAPKSTGKK